MFVTCHRHHAKSSPLPSRWDSEGGRRGRAISPPRSAPPKPRKPHSPAGDPRRTPRNPRLLKRGQDVARIRYIKPEFFDDEDLAAVSPLARLAFAGLWCQADRAGRLEDRPARLKARVLPHDDVSMDGLLTELARGQFIIRYVVDGKGFIQIRSWEKHQRPHVKEPASTYPAPTLHLPCTDPAPTQHLPKTLENFNGEWGTGTGTENGGQTSARVLTLSPGQLQAAAPGLIGAWNNVAAVVEPFTAVDGVRSHPKVTAALRAHPDMDWWTEVFRRVALSDFLRGLESLRDGRRFVADFWWVLEHADAIASGRYDNRDRASTNAAVLDKVLRDLA